MNYKEREIKFYKEIETIKSDIEGLDVSDDERTRLYELVHETTQRYSENMETLKEGIINAEELVKREWQLIKSMRLIAEKSEETLNQLEGILGVLESKNKLLN